VGRLPDFVLIGAMRSGSTALARYLGAHPQVFMAAEKELHFFLDNYGRGEDWYRSQFAAARPDELAGEATPRYLATPLAMERLRALLPDARLLVIVRHPVDRAWSHYWMRRDLGIEPRTFPEAIESDRARLAANGPDTRGADYLQHGLYDHHLAGVERLFPRQQVHVTIFERLVAAPLPAYADVCRFLGVDGGVAPALVGRPVNAYSPKRSATLRSAATRLPRLAPALNRLNRRRGRSYPALDASVRAELDGYFAAPNAALERRLGAAIPEWAPGLPARPPRPSAGA
jgi:hypothetical protein